MFTQTDYDKLQQIMEESPEKKELITRLQKEHQMEISSLSHEIRNPLTLIYSTLQLIESRHPEVFTYEHWNAMHCDIEYMNQLLQELSSYNNSERLSLKTLHTVGFLQSLVLSFAASVTDTDIEFTSRIEPMLPDICADAVKLRQILLNLLKNACDAVTASFGYAEKQRPSISFDASVENESIHIIVSDNGCGIHPESIDTIFEPFITYKKNGTGLGLPIARRIAIAHGGSLTVFSEPDRLTRFTLTLPVPHQNQNAF